ncbi:unnamed protein product, partial [Rotaria sordida]
NHNITSFIEHDSGLSENELNQTTIESIQPKCSSIS